MKTITSVILFGGFGFAVLGLLLIGCEEHSQDIPTSYTTMDQLMATGWGLYNSGDYLDAQQIFWEATNFNALYLPAYDGLGWCAVRLTDFTDAAVQFSFITTLADPATQAPLLADAYAGLALSAAIERAVMELSEAPDPAALQALAQESISSALIVFALMPLGYAPADHDAGFGSADLHLLNAQNYFYLQEFENAEMELTSVDTANFVAETLQQMGTVVNGEVDSLVLTVENEDSTWFLIPVNPGIHHFTQITAPVPDSTLQYVVQYSENQIQVMPDSGTTLEGGMTFTVDYVYLEDFADYLYQLLQYIESLIDL